MSGILFIVPGLPLVFNYSGAASRYAQNFLALQNLAEEVHVLRFHTEGCLQAVLDFEALSNAAQNTRQAATSWQDVELPANRVRNRFDVLQRMLFDPLATEFPQYKFLAQAIQAHIHLLNPHLLWAEHSDAAAAVWSIRPTLPWIYSQTDMRYLIRSIRMNKPGLYQTVYDLVSRDAESRVSRGANIVITGSVTEKERLEKVGSRSVIVIPMVNDDFPSLDLDFHPPPDIRLIHLGSLETTANRSGLISYLSQAHSLALAQRDLTLMIVGDATRVKPPLSGLLLQPGVVCAGYIADLGTVLRPYDIAILPYIQDSGYRTKLPLLMGYAQVIMATRAALAGSLLPGLEQVCVLLDRVEDFPEKIAWLAAHPEERRRLGLAGRAFAEQHFSLGAVLPLYIDLIRQVASFQPASQRAGT